MTKAEAKRQVSEEVYKHAAKVYETLELEGKIFGNGHHMAQRIADQAANLIEERWIARE